MHSNYLKRRELRRKIRQSLAKNLSKNPTRPHFLQRRGQLSVSAFVQVHPHHSALPASLAASKSDIPAINGDCCTGLIFGSVPDATYRKDTGSSRPGWLPARNSRRNSRQPHHAREANPRTDAQGEGYPPCGAIFRPSDENPANPSSRRAASHISEN